MAIDFPVATVDGQIVTISGRQYIWDLGKNRWESYGGFAQATFTKPTSPVNGETYFDPTTGAMEVWDSSTTSWVGLTTTAVSYLESAQGLLTTESTNNFAIPTGTTEIIAVAQPIAAYRSGEFVRIRVGNSSGILTSNYWYNRTAQEGSGVNCYGTRNNPGWDLFPLINPDAAIFQMNMKKAGSSNLWVVEGDYGYVDGNKGGNFRGSIDTQTELTTLQFTGSGAGGVYRGPNASANPEIRIYYK